MTANTDPVFKPPSAVERIGQHLRAMALKMSEGDYIGSEQSLSRQLQVSGPTLRQAIRLLEHEGLVRVRRGVRGGYYVGQANIDTLTRSAATYLQGNIRSFDEITDFIRFVLPFQVDTIMANARVGELAPYAEHILAETHAEFVGRQTDFMKLIMDLAGDNVPLQFIMTVLYQIVSNLPLAAEDAPVEDIRSIEALRAELAGALVAGDRDRAIAAYGDANGLVLQSIKEYLAGGGETKP